MKKVPKVRLLFRMAAFRAFVMLLLAAIIYGQEKVAVPTTIPAIDLTPSGMTKDVWFWIFVASNVFSAIVTAMPEPTQVSSPWYIWAYRAGHTLSMQGTSFFQNKMYWPNSVTGPQVTEQSDKPKKVDAAV